MECSLKPVYTGQAPVLYREYKNLGNDFCFWWDVENVPVVSYENPLVPGEILSVACNWHQAVDATHASAPLGAGTVCAQEFEWSAFVPLGFQADEGRAIWRSPSNTDEWPFDSILLDGPAIALVTGDILTVDGFWCRTALPLGLSVQYGYFRWTYHSCLNPEISYCIPRPLKVAAIPMDEYLEFEEFVAPAPKKRSGFWSYKLEMGDMTVET